MWKTILLPLDGSDISEKAIPVTVDLAQKFGAKVRLLRALWPLEVWPHDAYALDESAYSRVLEVDAQNCLKYLEQKVAQLKGLGIEDVSYLPTIHTRVPEDWICEQAAQNEVDLVVMAFHGRSGMHRFFHGSVAEHVARQSRCPVLLVPTGEH